VILVVVVVLFSIATGTFLTLFSSWPPLNSAARNGHVGAIRVLAGFGADVETRDKGGRTPLHWAARNGHAGAIRALVAAGADAEARDKDGATPLHLAAWQGPPDAVRALLDAGADAGARTTNGRLAADIAAESVRNHPVFRELDTARTDLTPGPGRGRFSGP